MTTIADRPDIPATYPSLAPLRPDDGARPAARSRTSRAISKVFSEGWLVFLLPLTLYLVVGVLLDFKYVTFNGDAASRMANGFYVLYSRDPHLAAVGFVWNPGPSIVDLVPLLFYHLWTPLASHMFAASIASAVCMAGAVYQVGCTLKEWGVGRAPRLLLVAFFALNAMIVYEGGNGMSEGLYLFTLCATCRYLLRWLRDNDLASLVYAASALGVCYIARNEAVGPAMAAGAVVLGVSFARRSASRSDRFGVPLRTRIWGALTDATIFEMPFVTAFVAWAFISYIITGQAFGQFTSVYGTASQLKVSSSEGGGPPPLLSDRILHDVHDVLYLAPMILVILALAIVLSLRRRDVGILAPLSVLGAGVGFDALAYITNSIAQWFRYFLAAVPLEVLLVGCIFATTPALIGVARPHLPTRSRNRRLLVGVGAVVGVFLLLAPSAVTTVMGMSNPKVGFEERQHLAFIFTKHPSKADKAAPATWPGMVSTTNYLVDQHLADGQVLVDNFSGCVPQIIAMSPNPKIFVIPNDRDFQRTLDDPLTFHAHYILDVDPVGNGTLTAINILYPALWKTGAGFSKQVHDFPAAGECPEFRLFKVTSHPNQAA